MDTPQTIEPVIQQYNSKIHISKQIINRVVKDTQAKIEMVLRELPIPGLLDASVRVGRRRRGGNPVLSAYISINNSLRESLEQVYTKQITEHDSTFKSLRFSVDQLKTQYKSCLANYGLEYDDYRDPFESVKDLCVDKVLGNGIAKQRYGILDTLIVEKKKVLENYLDVSTLIENEAIRLNATANIRRKNERIRRLNDFAEQQIKNLMIIRDQLKRDMQNEYDKFKQEKVTKGYEDHGPISIL